MEGISKEMIRTVAALANLQLTEGEEESARRDLQEILAYAELLSQLDTSQAEDAVPRGPAGSTFREDRIAGESLQEELLSLAPDREGPYFRVPRTVE